MQLSPEPVNATSHVPSIPSMITNSKRAYVRVRESKLSGRQSNALVRGSLLRKVIDRKFNEKSVTEGYFNPKNIIFAIDIEKDLRNKITK